MRPFLWPGKLKKFDLKFILIVSVVTHKSQSNWGDEAFASFQSDDLQFYERRRIILSQQQVETICHLLVIE